jgi:hypothetical protein
MRKVRKRMAPVRAIEMAKPKKTILNSSQRDMRIR